ncbi:uncharacterized protein [Argopecten irradians]|uniref:uncharacterized protein n=1 Tax=Argopecten irradians TaxID=31199 RepID=UPI00371AFE14
MLMLMIASLVFQFGDLQSDMQWAFNMTQHMQNQSHQMLAMEQLLYCGSQRLCSIGIANNTTVGFSCCAPCSCDDTCIMSGSCCLDKALEEDSLDILSRKGSSCVLPQLKPFEENGVNTNQHFLMIGLCPTTFLDESVKIKCESDNISRNDVTDFIPVSSVKTNETYRYKHCAFCNWEKDKDLLYWQTSFACQGSGRVFPNKAEELFRYILNEDNCNLFYQPPDDVSPLQCMDQSLMYTTCNVTGLWREYNSDVEWACRHYDNTYEHNYQYYKNIFCYICNTNDTTIPSCFWDFSYSGESDRLIGIDGITGITSFAALFNFIEDPPAEERPDVIQLCDPNFQFDTYKNVCREITCSPPFLYNDGVCQNAFSRVASQKYEMFLRFNKSASYYTNCDICPRLTPVLIQEYLRSHLITKGYYQYTCGLNVLSFNDSCFLGKEDDAGYLIIHVELLINDFHDPMKVAKTFLNASAFHVESSSGPSLCVDFVPKVLGGTFYERETEYLTNVPKYRDPSTGDPMNFHSFYWLGQCPSRPWMSRLIPAFVCPHVNISLTGYNLTQYPNELCLDIPDTCFQPEDYILSEDMSSVLVCGNKYFSIHSTDPTISDQVSAAKVLVSFVFSCLSVLCLIITMVTYTLFPVLRTLPGLYTMALCATLIVAHTLFTFGGAAVNIKILCEVFGIIIHLTMLASVFLMNVCSVHMFRVFNHLERQYSLTGEEKRRHFVISIVYSYGASAIFVLGRIVYSVVTTGMSGYGIRICFINNTNALMLSFTLPVMALVLANIIMFIVVVIRVSRLPNMSNSSSRRHHQKRFLIYVKLSSLTGVAWLFGFIAEISNHEVFVYLFIILLAGQGVFIMLSFIFNKRVYKLYATYTKRGSSRTSSRTHAILDNSLSNYTTSSKTEHTTLPNIPNDINCPTIEDNGPIYSNTRL